MKTHTIKLIITKTLLIVFYLCTSAVFGYGILKTASDSRQLMLLMALPVGLVFIENLFYMLNEAFPKIPSSPVKLLMQIFGLDAQREKK